MYVCLGCTSVNIFHIPTSSSCLETQVKLSFSTARKFYILTKYQNKVRYFSNIQRHTKFQDRTLNVALTSDIGIIVVLLILAVEFDVHGTVHR
jgi:predicted Fe-Mo cluster-binding NifX family protein